MLHDIKIKVILPEFKLFVCHIDVVIFNYNQICQLLQNKEDKINKGEHHSKGYAN